MAPGVKPTARRLGSPTLRTIRAKAVAYCSSVPDRVEAKADRRAQLEPGVADGSSRNPPVRGQGLLDRHGLLVGTFKAGGDPAGQRPQRRPGNMQARRSGRPPTPRSRCWLRRAPLRVGWGSRPLTATVSVEAGRAHQVRGRRVEI